MEIHLLDRSSSENGTFSISKKSYPYFLKVWHYHPEFELVVILKSTGTRFIGDNIEKFEKGEVVLIGKNLPHMWLNDDVYFEEESSLTAEATAIHFKNDFLGLGFFQSIEMKPISLLFDKAAQGIRFVDIGNKFLTKVHNILDLEGFEKTIAFLEILNELANHKNYKLLSSKGFTHTVEQTSINNLNKVYEYVYKNFTNHMNLKIVADIASMNISAFSRFFKRVNGKTFSSYLNEIRIGYACKLLIENQHKITVICYMSGYNNISNFNRQFKLIMNQSPSEFQIKYSEL